MNRRRLFVMGCAVVAFGACGSAANSGAPTTTTVPAATLMGCVLPRLPVPGAGSQFGLGGPAVAALRGGAARFRFELDGGAFTVTPPRAGDHLLVSANEAKCAALASIGPNGRQLLELAADYGGVTAGYGRVSIAPELIAASSTTTYVAASGLNQNTNPKLPAPSSYQQRLAWLVVVKNVLIFNGPAMPAPDGTTTPSASKPATYGYLVFVVDARTGSDALLYAEAQPGPVAPSASAWASPSVSVPAERVSVPWTLVSRSPDGYAGQLRAVVLACDGLPNPVAVDHDRAAVAVVVERPVGATCGTPRPVTLPVHASVVTSDLPADIAHDPTGPVVELPSATPQNDAQCSADTFNGRTALACQYTGPGATAGVLRSLFESDNNRTIHITVGSVLAIAPLHDTTHYAALPVTSNAPTVLGPLDGFKDAEVSEFRAWHTGHADLYVPAHACEPNSSARPCAPPWIVHVDVN